MSTKKKGNVLIEIPVVIGIMALISLISYETIVKANKAYKLRSDIRKVSVVFKGVCGELMYNTDFNELKEKIGEQNTLYINEDNLDIDKIKENDVKNIMENNMESQDKYIKIQVEKNEEIIDLKLTLEGDKVENIDLENHVYLSENLRL